VNRRTGKPISQAIWYLIPGAAVLLIFLFYPFRYVFEFDPDEGINAIKAMMSLYGYPLFTQVWSDQPPLLNMLLTETFGIFGLNITIGRMVILAFSALIIFLVFDMLLQAWGRLPAVLGTIILLSLPFYMRLSVSLMIGLPAIALALLALWALNRWHHHPKNLWLIVVGISLGLSIMTKAFTLILAPIFFAGIGISCWRKFRQSGQSKDLTLPPAVWLAAFLATTSIIAWFYIGFDNIGELVTVHLQSMTTAAGAFTETPISISYFLREISALLLIAGAGLIFALVRRAYSAIYLGLWIIAAYILLSLNQPAWYHHELLISVPASILAAIGLGQALRLAARALKHRSVLPVATITSVALIAIGSWYLIQRLPKAFSELNFGLPNLSPNDVIQDSDRHLLSLIYDYSSKTHWLFTDRPMFAFITGIPVPPDLAVITSKRLATGALTNEEVLQTLETYKPEQVLIGRFSIPAAEIYMRDRNFVRVDEAPNARLYIRKDIIGNGSLLPKGTVEASPYLMPAHLAPGGLVKFPPY
jgi:4-amino-4-deoxy-L-arabinose transferase-like glycosyltransferase